MNNCHFTKHLQLLLHLHFQLQFVIPIKTRSSLMSFLQFSPLPSSTQNPNVHPSPCNFLLHHLRRRCYVIPRTPRNSFSHRPILADTLSITIPRDAPFRCFSSMSSIEAAPNAIPQLQDSLLYSRAYWVSKSLIALKAAGGGQCFLYASKAAALSVADDGVQGYDVEIKLERSTAGLPVDVVEKFPHIQDYECYQLAEEVDVQNLLKCQLAVATYGADGRCYSVTGLQLPGVLDELFAYTGPLGAVFSDGSVSLHLWAPTAQSVEARIYGDPSGADILEVVQLKETNGVWSVSGPKRWEGCYYNYEVTVYHPSTLRVEKCSANDPYAKGLSSDGRRTLLVDLSSDSVKPDRWDTLANEKPILPSFSDISIYELHIRDFSFNDHTVAPEIRGGYLAFTLKDSAGMLHLKKLSSAGLTHIHLLPTFQFAGVDDEKEKWKCIDFKELEQFPPDSMEQQAQVSVIQNEDGYNWGYNPVLWGVPKGSYASNANGPFRAIEFRKMVQELNRIGLRVVLDVVYNHVHGNGPVDVNSVYDKIVPGYYLRRNSDGFVENSTCVNNTASEHFMVERLIIDDLLGWAVDYKVDGFRLDLMGHLMKRTMLKAKTALQSLSKEENGVDGSSIYLYGEGWDFGEVANNGRGINASQFNMSGSGVGSFNDRIRDAMLGGSPFGHPLQQGYATGLFLEPNDYDYGPEADPKLMLASSMDHIKAGIAGNLRDFVFTNYEGREVKASEVLTYGGTPVAYTLSPTETVNYVSAHDNETLFDIVSMKTPMHISVEERCRLNHLATSVVALSQGIPFFHCGDEMLRSKSLDRDSYNSGDWFNRLDFSYNSNNWGIGLPPKEKNEAHWPLIKARLADPSFKPGRSHILGAVDNFLDLLRIRYSSPLFRLGTANAIQERVRFHNSGPSAIPGVIVMSIEDGGHEGAPAALTPLDPLYSRVVVIFNACPHEISIATPALQARSFQLHPVQVKSSDEVVKRSSYETSSGCFFVPGRTTSVFVEPR